MNLRSTTMRLWGELTSLRLDIELLKMAGNDPKTLREREMKALQIANQLRAECNPVMQ